MRHFRHLSYTKRLQMEQMIKDGKSPYEIAVDLKFHISTYYREKKRGECHLLNSDLTYRVSYAAELAHEKYRENLKYKGAPLKIGKDHALAEHIENKIINEKYSPAAVLMEIQNKGMQFRVSICTATLYSYIDKNVFLLLTNKNLPEGKRNKRKYCKVKPARPPAGQSIENRPKEVDTREVFGHWEMDTVKGKKTSKNSLLVLTERKTLKEIEIRLPRNTAENVVKSLNRLERKYGSSFAEIFKSITMDNGTEFSDYEGMRRSCLRKRARTDFYYCHPYSSYERPQNENSNKLIRRWILKGTPIENYSDKQIQHCEYWINHYPRAVLGGRTSEELFQEELAKLNSS